MTKLLLHIFVKNHENIESPQVHSAIGKLAGTTGIICNFLLFALKLTVGILSGAVSVIADALNNLSDAGSSVVTLLGFRLAQKPADKNHPYGHARFEYLSALIVAVLIMLIGLDLGEGAVRKIFVPSPVELSYVAFGVLICSVALKFWMCFFFSKLGKKISSQALRATAVDCRNDVIASSAVLLGCAVEKIFEVPLDGYVGLLVAAFILFSGIGVARQTISPLLGERADRELVDKISNLVLSNEKVLGIHDLLVHDYGPGKSYASVHVEISAAEDSVMCHEIIDSIECNALEELNVHLVIHYDPVMEEDSEWVQMRSVMEEIIHTMNPAYSMHDFRLVRGCMENTLVFDLVIPYDQTEDTELIKQQLDNALAAQDYSYKTVVRFDNHT